MILALVVRRREHEGVGWQPPSGNSYITCRDIEAHDFI
jgi:hypothetical protein